MNGNGKLIAATLSAAIAVAAGPLAVWNVLSNEMTDTKRRVDTIEKRGEEDRRATTEALRRIEQKTESTDKNVQEIRILLEGMKREGGERRR